MTHPEAMQLRYQAHVYHENEKCLSVETHHTTHAACELTAKFLLKKIIRARITFSTH